MTLTYNSKLARDKVDPYAQNKGIGSNLLDMGAQIDRWADGQTDRMLRK